jgi:hypothetical protein
MCQTISRGKENVANEMLTNVVSTRMGDRLGTPRAVGISAAP